MFARVIVMLNVRWGTTCCAVASNIAYALAVPLTPFAPLAPLAPLRPGTPCGPRGPFGS